MRLPAILSAMQTVDTARRLQIMTVMLAAYAQTPSLASAQSAAAAEKPTLSISVVDAEDQPQPCRVHLRNHEGKAQQPDGLPFWRDHFVCPGNAELVLDPGSYDYTIERGPEYVSRRGTIKIEATGAHRLREQLTRISDLARQGWYGGDLHVHRDVEEMPLLMQAEDLHVAPVITWWNQRNLWQGRALPAQTLRETAQYRYFDVMAGEDERRGGAVLFFHLQRPLAIANAQPEYPTASSYIRQAHRQDPNVWIEIEKPFWWDVPLWLASGQIDSIGIAHNHMWHGGVLGNEAWGRARDARRYPGPLGNGNWTQDIYYHVLNCGLRIPPSAGSASGVLPNPVGYNRAYVHVESDWSYGAWWQGLRAGRVFVTNGPMLVVTAAGQLPGHVFSTAAGKPLTIEIEAKLSSREAIDKLQIIQDGRVAATLDVPRDGAKGATGNITCSQSGWFLVRALTTNKDTFRFASTGPFYVEVGQSERVIRESAMFFLDWAQERRDAVAAQLTGVMRDEVLAEHDAAIQFWQRKVRRSATSTP